MTDRPILFSAPMVRALLAGTKTQTRRVFNLPKWAVLGTLEIDDDGPYACAEISGCLAKVPTRVNPGDRLYVREHWKTDLLLDALPPRDITGRGTNVLYLADNSLRGSEKTWVGAGRFRHGMHMPRWASRITLIVTDVRVERLQDISEADAIAEGVPADFLEHIHGPGGYRDIWDTINGIGAWETNPWVVAYTFTVHRGNIDVRGR